MVTSRIVETGIIQSNHKDSSKTKRVTFLKREVMPYAKSKAGEVFNGLMELVLSPDNIMLACVPLWLPLYSLRRGF